MERVDSSELELEEKLMTVDRVTKVVKGGRRLRFRALMVVGDGNGHVGVGLAKATGVPEAIRKASAMGRRELIDVLVVNETIPHEALAKYGASLVLLKPAAAGRGMIASNTVRTVLQLAGIKNIISKSLGSQNRINVARATILALTSLRSVDRTSSKSGVEAVLPEVYDATE
ncbi:30S ribosomal protein S5 [Candidatus Bipolaricaulota bacterium]|nr:30S ribosomal protein S5 [Candidatus Bipolaricaulota bacterium]